MFFFYYFLPHPWQIIFEPIQYFYAKNALILLHKCNFYCKAPKNQHAFFIVLKKVLVCSIGYLHTGKIFYNFFSTFVTSVFWISSNITIHRCCHKILFISEKTFLICVIKSFMRPRFFFITLYDCDRHLFHLSSFLSLSPTSLLL